MGNIFAFFMLLEEYFTIPLAYLFLALFCVSLCLTISSVKAPSRRKWITLFCLDLAGLSGALILFIADYMWGYGGNFDNAIVSLYSLGLFGILIIADFLLLAHKWNPSKN